MITGVHHISFAVSDISRSLHFYCEGLGFTILSDRVINGVIPEEVTRLKGAELRVVHLKGYDIGLELIQYLSPQGRPKAPLPCDVGSAHICFLVNDIDKEILRLTAFGAEFLSEAKTVEGGPNAGNRYVYFIDHDGIPMELSQPTQTRS